MGRPYDAFISYRHLPADIAVAEKLEDLLEGRKKKDGTVLSVFRDKSDLPTSGDLGADIREALEGARYFVMVCSPTYRESKWCMEELRYFRELHGNTNEGILPILVEGEPEDTFPELLRFEERKTPDGQTVQMEVEPLGADVRGQSIREQKKKLKTEYLRVAAHMLGVSYEELLNKAQRRRRAVTALVVAALVAFGIYTSVMITQITDRQKKLEAKQVELYENESKRLANQALELLGEDNAKAMLLANAALPEDLTEPEYPLTDEAKLAIQSVALQYQLEEKSEPFTQRSSFTFDNADWQVGRFYDDGRYLTVYDYEKTWLYNTQTGNLIATLPGVEYYFFDGVAKHIREEETLLEDGRISVTYTMFDTFTGEALGRTEAKAEEAMKPTTTFSIYDEADGKLWIVEYVFADGESEPTYFAIGWMDEKGNFFEAETLPEAVETTCREHGETSYQDGGIFINSGGLISGDCDLEASGVVVAEEYQKLLDAFEKVEPGCAPYAVSIVDDGRIGIIQLHRYGEGGVATAFWDMGSDRLLRLFEYGCFWEAQSGLIYRVMDHELQIWEINPENFGNFQNVPPFEYVSNDGKIGYMRYYTGERSGDSLSAYHMDDLGDFVCEEADAFTSYVVDAGNDLLQEELRFNQYSITTDGKYLAMVTEDKKLLTFDVEADAGTIRNIDEVDKIDSLSISAGGNMLACTKEEEDGVWVALYDLEEKKGVESFLLPGSMGAENVTAYVELGKGKMLVQWGEDVLLYELDDLNQKPWEIKTDAIQGNLASWESREWKSLHWPTRKAMTRDSLLFLTVMNPTAVGSLYKIQGIFDLNTREEIGYVRVNAGYREDYYYDDVGGNLILKSNNSFTVERRGESGDFEVIYTITPRNNDMELLTAGHITDGTWLVLQNDEVCEIYDLSGGTLCYMLQKPADRSCQLAVIDGKLYDFCAGWTGESIPLPGVTDARSIARETLTEGDSRRTLTDQEFEIYYVPSEWRVK